MAYHVTAEYASQNFGEILHRAQTETDGVLIVQENHAYVLISQEELETVCK